ncbi:MAG: tripartite tricarboxylate transporter substrate binding protein [Pseudomonadota bacterium]
MNRFKTRLGRLLTAMSLLVAAHAQAFPDRPVTLVVPGTPGGLTDTLARLIAPKFAEAWGQPVVVENRPGAGALIGTQYAMRAKPDGHTLLMGSTDVLTLPLLNRNIAIDTLNGLQPIGRIASMPLLMLGSSRVAARTLPELVEAMRKAPGRYTYASNGNASILQLYAEMYSHEVGAKLLHVPYRGAVEATQALASGEVDFLIQPATGNVLGQIAAGRATPYAVLSAERLAALPDLPTISELGWPRLTTELWYGLFAPANVPRAIVEQINSDLRALIRSDDVGKRLAAYGLSPRPMGAAEFSSFYLQEHRQWEKVIRDAGIQAN